MSLAPWHNVLCLMAALLQLQLVLPLPDLGPLVAGDAKLSDAELANAMDWIDSYTKVTELNNKGMDYLNSGNSSGGEAFFSRAVDAGLADGAGRLYKARQDAIT